MLTVVIAARWSRRHPLHHGRRLRRHRRARDSISASTRVLVRARTTRATAIAMMADLVPRPATVRWAPTASTAATVVLRTRRHPLHHGRRLRHRHRVTASTPVSTHALVRARTTRAMAIATMADLVPRTATVRWAQTASTAATVVFDLRRRLRLPCHPVGHPLRLHRHRRSHLRRHPQYPCARVASAWRSYSIVALLCKAKKSTRVNLGAPF